MTTSIITYLYQKYIRTGTPTFFARKLCECRNKCEQETEGVNEEQRRHSTRILLIHKKNNTLLKSFV